MPKTTITDFEDEITAKKDVFYEAFEDILLLQEDEIAETPAFQRRINHLTKTAGDFFSLFDRFLSEYRMGYFDSNKNIQTIKIDSTVNNLNTILTYWGLY
ncbi:hypothetical protein LCGC14_0710510 [marine sediment metagenome]|uniref:RteC protein n=2 Tax=root TaxID=1 RepID=A0A831QLS9_9FLAO|nr:hypothetical protein [Pricia antarctica]